MHRRDIGINDGINRTNVVVSDVINSPDVVVNDGVKGRDVVVNGETALSVAEERAINGLLRNPRLTASALAVLLETSPRQAQRIIASLKRKVGLKRRGADKNGEWYFESGVSEQ